MESFSDVKVRICVRSSTREVDLTMLFVVLRNVQYMVQTVREPREPAQPSR